MSSAEEATLLAHESNDDAGILCIWMGCRIPLPYTFDEIPMFQCPTNMGRYGRVALGTKEVPIDSSTSRRRRRLDPPSGIQSIA